MKVLYLVDVACEGLVDVARSARTESEFLTYMKVCAGHKDIVGFHQVRKLEMTAVDCFLCLVRVNCTCGCISEHNLVIWSMLN